MKAVIQRVKKASVSVYGETIGEIEKGLVVLLGITHSDTEKDADFLAEKIAYLRIFDDKDGKMNLSGMDVGAGFLVVSQFTLYGDCRKGRRPSYTEAAPTEKAEPLYEYFAKKISEYGCKVGKGKFGAEMLVSLENDGPVTLIVDSGT
jgi:D-tyrosyl-tRNA(Tyr) deacylase